MERGAVFEADRELVIHGEAGHFALSDLNIAGVGGLQGDLTSVDPDDGADQTGSVFGFNDIRHNCGHEQA